jgi:excisionase family DNA binding protein
METMKNWLTQEELHRRWDVSYLTIRKWRELGLPCYKVGKKVCFNESEVVKFIREKLLVSSSVTKLAPQVADDKTSDAVAQSNDSV